MIIRFTEEEYENAKSGDFLPLECEVCKKIFYARKSAITYELKHKKGGSRFCSQECFHTTTKKELIHTQCAHCGKDLYKSAKEWKKSKTKNFFCSASCMNAYYKKLNGDEFKLTDKLSDEEFKKLITNSTSFTDFAMKVGYSCGSSQFNTYAKNKCKELGIDIPFETIYKIDENNKNIPIKKRSKGDVFYNSRNYQSSRTQIRKDAEKTFKKLDGNYECCICGYNKYVEVAHVKSVSSFDDGILIEEINDIKNLVPLCPNHHWEFDNGKMSEKDKEKIKRYITLRDSVKIG